MEKVNHLCGICVSYILAPCVKLIRLPFCHHFWAVTAASSINLWCISLSLSLSLPSPLTVTLRKDIVTAMHFPTMRSIAIDMCFVVHDRIRSSSRAFTRGKNGTPEMGLPPTATVANGKLVLARNEKVHINHSN